MRVLIATDAWHPQVNGVVRTLGTVAVFLPLYFAGFRTSGRRLLVIAWIIHGLGLVAVAVNPGGSCFFIYAAAFLGFTDPPAGPD